jgi:hypothetical protein
MENNFSRSAGLLHCWYSISSRNALKQAQTTSPRGAFIAKDALLWQTE